MSGTYTPAPTRVAESSVKLTSAVYQATRRAIVGALKDAIHQHGPVTESHDAASSVKRIIGMVWGTLRNEGERQKGLSDPAASPSLPSAEDARAQIQRWRDRLWEWCNVEDGEPFIEMVCEIRDEMDAALALPSAEPSPSAGPAPSEGCGDAGHSVDVQLLPVLLRSP